jgi:hypothetical protein
MGPSPAELTWPVNAIGACARTGPSVSPTVITPAAKVSKRLRGCIGVSSMVGQSLSRELCGVRA